MHRLRDRARLAQKRSAEKAATANPRAGDNGGAHQAEQELHEGLLGRVGRSPHLAARAAQLVADPAVMFLDEPTSGIDATVAKSLLQTLHHLPEFRRAIYTIPTRLDNESESVPLEMQQHCVHRSSLCRPQMCAMRLAPSSRACAWRDSGCCR